MQCPHCLTAFDYTAVYNWFVGHDYSTDFEHDCPTCEQPIAVEVEAIPEFKLSKPDRRIANVESDSV